MIRPVVTRRIARTWALDVYTLNVHAPKVVLRSFGDKDTERLAKGRYVRRFSSVERIMQRKVATLDAATSLLDLGRLPGSRLESLKGDLAGKYSIRINDQWRIVFAWVDNNAENVAIIDYH